uniref:Cysteine protease n=1 Tax=Caligus clemensi TaxID=344056 RepID=C1C1J1_CALCM|nr:Cysteine protease ATG4B [Caligus clemensi]
MDLYFEASSLYYGSDLTERTPQDQWPDSDSPVWILGNELCARNDIAELNSEVLSRLLFTYRKEFSEIDGSGYTSDSGWGCMLRCGQMVLGEALQRISLGRDWKWDHKVDNEVDEDLKGKYLKILNLFQDSKVAPYSIHQIALMGESIQSKKPVGTWFGPNTVAQVLKKLSFFEKTVPIRLHVAMDNTVIIDEIKESCGFVGGDSEKPLLLFIPLRLGLTEINPIYFQDLKECFEFPQILGVIGGRPNHALYFIGYVDNELIYLDPHISTQSASSTVDTFGGPQDQTHHTERAYRMDFKDLDPSLSLCFLCRNESEFEDMCERFLFKLIRGHNSPLFEICRQRPEHLMPLPLSSSLNSDLPNAVPEEVKCAKDFVEVKRALDTSDEEFEIL